MKKLEIGKDEARCLGDEFEQKAQLLRQVREALYAT